MTYHFEGKQSTRFCHGTILDTLARVLLISKHRVAITLYNDTLLIASENLGSGTTSTDMCVTEKEHILKAINGWTHQKRSHLKDPHFASKRIKKLCLKKWKRSLTKNAHEQLPEAFVHLILEFAMDNKQLDYEAMRNAYPDAKVKDLIKPAILLLLYFNNLVQDFRSLMSSINHPSTRLERDTVQAIEAQNWRIILCGEPELEPEVRLCQYVVNRYRHEQRAPDLQMLVGTSEVTSDKIRIIMDLFQEHYKRKYNSTLNIESLGTYDDPNDPPLPKYINSKPKLAKRYQKRCDEAQQINDNLKTQRYIKG